MAHKIKIIQTQVVVPKTLLGTTILLWLLKNDFSNLISNRKHIKLLFIVTDNE